MDKEEIAWLAGLIEGEGNVHRTTGGSACLQIAMCDREPLDRAARIVGHGTVRGPYEKKKPNHSPSFYWGIAERSIIKEVLEAIYPWMSEKRKSQIDLVRPIFNTPKKPPSGGWHFHKTHHAEDPDCSICKNNASARKYKRKKSGWIPNIALGEERGWLS